MSDGKENSKGKLEVVDVETLFQKFEELVDQASDGKEFVIAEDNEPIAKLVPMELAFVRVNPRRRKVELAISEQPGADFAPS